MSEDPVLLGVRGFCPLPLGLGFISLPYWVLSNATLVFISFTAKTDVTRSGRTARREDGGGVRVSYTEGSVVLCSRSSFDKITSTEDY